jgi:hypothetical protein
LTGKGRGRMRLPRRLSRITVSRMGYPRSGPFVTRRRSVCGTRHWPVSIAVARCWTVAMATRYWLISIIVIGQFYPTGCCRTDRSWPSPCRPFRCRRPRNRRWVFRHEPRIPIRSARCPLAERSCIAGFHRSSRPSPIIRPRLRRRASSQPQAHETGLRGWGERTRTRKCRFN